MKCPPYLGLICDSDSTAFKVTGYISFLSSFSMRFTLKDKNLLPKEQILSSKSRPFFIGFVIQGSKQEVTKVVLLSKNGN